MEKEDGESEEVNGEADAKEEPVSYFFDTYAIIEILKQNPSYASYQQQDVAITIFNLAELYAIVLREYGETQANTVYVQYKKSVVEIDDETLKEAVKFRKSMNKRQLSYADCIGYIYAKRHGMKFLTGDPQFESMENVEFVK